MALEADDEADADKEPTEDVGDELEKVNSPVKMADMLPRLRNLNV